MKKQTSSKTRDIPTVVNKKDALMALLRLKTPKLFDREPQGYSEKRLSQLADDIIDLI